MIFQFNFFAVSIRLESQGQHRDTDVLLRSLVEAEIDGVAVTNQLTALKETVLSLAKVYLALTDHFVL